MGVPPEAETRCSGPGADWVEDDDVVLAPGAAARLQRGTDGERSPAASVDLLEQAVGEKGNVASVGRPEGVRRAFLPGNN